MNIIIFAGGMGTRLWPASRKSTPKQLLKFIGNDTLLQHTYKRVRKGVKADQVFIAINSAYASQVRKQLPSLPKSHYSLEPMRKNRGPALGLAALIMDHQSKDKIFATAWADDHITQAGLYHNTLKLGEKYLKSNPKSIIAVGIKPTSAHTGFCYLQTGKSQGRIGTTDSVGKSIFAVKRFTDKPNKKQAEKYLASDNYYWNTGYFISHVDHVLALYKKYKPKAYALLMKIKPYIGTPKQTAMIAKYYAQMPEFDFEEILNAHPEQLLALKASFDWADVGRWSVVKDIQSGKTANLAKGKVLDHETTGSLIYNYNPKQLVTTLHVKNLVVVVTPEAVLVADKNNSEELKNLVARLQTDPKLKKYL